MRRSRIRAHSDSSEDDLGPGKSTITLPPGATGRDERTGLPLYPDGLPSDEDDAEDHASDDHAELCAELARADQDAELWDPGAISDDNSDSVDPELSAYQVEAAEGDDIENDDTEPYEGDATSSKLPPLTRGNWPLSRTSFQTTRPARSSLPSAITTLETDTTDLDHAANATRVQRKPTPPKLQRQDSVDIMDHPVSSTKGFNDLFVSYSTKQRFPDPRKQIKEARKVTEQREMDRLYSKTRQAMIQQAKLKKAEEQRALRKQKDEAMQRYKESWAAWTRKPAS